MKPAGARPLTCSKRSFRNRVSVTSTIFFQSSLVDAGGFIGSVLRFAIRGLEGLGAKSHLHTAKQLRLSTDLPTIVAIVDTRERIESGEKP